LADFQGVEYKNGLICGGGKLIREGIDDAHGEMAQEETF
jgi:hypothetical protein